MSKTLPIGSPVQFFDARILKRLGWHAGYGGQGAGPYAAIVIGHGGADNERLTLQVFAPDVPSWQAKLVPPKDEDVEEQEVYWTVPGFDFDVRPETED